MFVNIFLNGNPFIEAYIQSDYLGKLIFLSLFFLSIFTWIILLNKILITKRASFYSQNFQKFFKTQKTHPLALQYEEKKSPNPFYEIYEVLKKHTVDILNKNRHFNRRPDISYLSQADIDLVESHLMAAIALQVKSLEKNLFILSTIVSLAPFLGLLGTVWGILMTFSELKLQGSTQQMALGGLSLALTTTVIGLLDAIPALIGYNYLKNKIQGFATEMEVFSNEVLSSVELQYRKVEGF